jgi:hypothetical protein
MKPVAWIAGMAALILVGDCSLAAEKPHTVQPESLAKYWLVASTGEAMVPNSGSNLDQPSCAAVSYVIGKDGTTSHVKLERVVPEGDLGKVAVSVVKGLRYAAAPQNAGKDPVFTYVVMPFNLADPKSADPADRALRARVVAACKLDQLIY